MTRLSRPLWILFALVLGAIPVAGRADTTVPFTVNFSNLVTGAAAFQEIYQTFTFQKFDASLGTLQSVNLALNFSGTVVGTASNISQSETVNHTIFFDLADTSAQIAIAEPQLALTKTISGGTTTFGPQFQSTSLQFSVTTGDLRYEAWRNGPGTVNATLGVYFDNYALDPFYGLQFYDGTDTGSYNGSISISYTYIPEPGSVALILTTLGSLSFARRIRTRRDVG